MADYLVPVVGYLRFDTTQGVASLAAFGTAVEGATKASSAAAKTNTAAMKQWNKDTADATSAVTTGLLAVGAGAVAAAGAAVKMGADFETSTNKLVTSAGFSEKSIGAVRTGILDMASQVGDSAMDLSNAMYVIGSAGITQANDSLTVLRAVAEGAKAEGSDLATVANAATSAMADYHLGANDAALVTSRLITAVSMGKTTFQDLTGAMHSVLPVASAAHISMSDILGDLASMTEHGISAQQATDDLAHAIGHFQTTTAPQNKELALLGINAQQLSTDLGSKGLSGTLQEISDAIIQRMGPSGKVILDMQTALKGLPPDVQKLGAQVMDGSISMRDFTSATKDLNVEQAGLARQFATLETSTHGIGSAQKSGAELTQTYSAALKAATGDATSMNVALMLTGENAAYTNKAVNAVSGATTEAGNHVAGWASIQATFNQKMAEAKDGLEAAAIKMGERLLPMATQLLGYIAAHIPDLESLGNQLVNVALAVGRVVQWISPAIPLIATAVGLFIAWRTAMTIGMAIEGVVTMVQAFAGTLAILSAAEGEATVAQWLLNVAMDANPVGLAVLAIGLLIGAVILLATHWNQVTAALHAFWGKVQQVAGAISGFIQQHTALAIAIGVLLGPIGILIGLGALLITHWNQVSHVAMEVANVVKNFVVAHWQLLVGVFLASLGPIGWIIGAAALIITHWKQVSGFFAALPGEIGRAFSGLGSAVHGAWDDIVSLFRAGVAGATAVVSGFVNGVVGLFAWLYNHNYYFKFLVDSIKLTFEKGRDDVVAIWTAITSWLGARWQWVADTAASIWDAITAAIGSRLNEAWSAIESVWNRITGWLGGVWSQIADDAGRLWGVASSAIGAQVHRAWDTITGVFGGLGGWFADRTADAYSWGYNLIQAIGKGIGAAAGAIAQAVRSIGGVIADWLGFHSPTKLGPGAEADLWAPAFVRMYAAGLEAGAPQIASASAVLMGGLVRPGLSSTTGVGVSVGGAYSGAGVSADTSTALAQSGASAASMDDTNELLSALYQLLDERLPRGRPAGFSNRAYGPA